METNWAEDHLQTIRTLMERSAVYRRALAPIMVWTGIVGAAGGVLGWKMKLHTSRGFIVFWSITALLAIVGSFILVRRQSLRDAEPFWSPPTRRIAQGLLPAFFIVGFLNGTLSYMLPNQYPDLPLMLMAFWLWFYGCAAHAAGFFMTRGIKLFAWLFIIAGSVLFVADSNLEWVSKFYSPCLLMGSTFGGLHLAYGIYLYLTEKGKNAA